jgi:hypothetical protein
MKNIKADNLKPSSPSSLMLSRSSSSSSSSHFSTSFFTVQISDISKKLRSGEFKIAVYGLGHVGASIASVWLRAGAGFA